MTPVEITVRGEHVVLLPAERATVRAEVSPEAGSAPTVHAAAVASAAAVGDSSRTLHDPQAGPVTWWSSQQLRTWARRPHHSEGTQLPLVHHAQVSFSAKFADFGQLGAWLGRLTDVPGFAVGGIDWSLTAARRGSVERQVRTEAVRDARRRAQTYAEALDLGEVRLLALADAGMLGQGLAPVHGGGVGFSRMAASGGGEVAFVPEDVEVRALVDARFVVG